MSNDIRATTTTGSISLLSPDPKDVDIPSLARSLAKQCRWNGHIKGFYSVALHSVLVSESALLPDEPEYQLAGLMHDAAEAYMGDITTPVKQVLGKVVEELEARLMATIWQVVDPEGKFTHNGELLPGIAAAVRRADRAQTARERCDRARRYLPTAQAASFLYRYYELRGRIYAD